MQTQPLHSSGMRTDEAVQCENYRQSVGRHGSDLQLYLGRTVESGCRNVSVQSHCRCRCIANVFPERCRLFDSMPEHDLGMRQILVDNYSEVYVINRADVVVLRVLYSASDINARLRDDI